MRTVLMASSKQAIVRPSSPTIHAGLTIRIITRNDVGRAIIADEKTRLPAQSERLFGERHAYAIVLAFSPVFAAGHARRSAAGDVWAINIRPDTLHPDVRSA